MSHTTPTAHPPHHSFYRRTSSVLERARHNRPSFKAIWARASSLDLGHGDASSADTIARYFLHRPQDSSHARLLEPQRIGLRKLMNILVLSSLCSWQASRICGSLYKSILDATSLIARVQSILRAPSPHSQVGDLLLCLSDLQDLFSEQTLKEIEDGKALFFELDREIKRYQHRLLVKALSRMRAWDRQVQHRASRSRHAVIEAKAFLSRRLTACITGLTPALNSDRKEESLTDRESTPDDDGDDEDELHENTPDSKGISHCDPASVPGEKEKPEAFAVSGLAPVQKAHARLHKLEIYMHNINIMFDTLKALVEGTHNQTVKQQYIESLRDEPLMFYGVAELISSGHASLSKHLDDLREEVLICFCFINSARELVYTI